MSNDIFQSPEYKRSRKAYIAQCTFEYFVSILVTDAFLAKLLSYMGISDAMVGIISSLISFSFLFQLLTILLMTRLKNTKRTVIFFDTVSQLFFLGLYLTPFLPVSVEAKTVIVIACILLAYLTKYLITSLCFKWANSYVDPAHRGEYSAVKEMISLFTGIVFTLVIGYVIDYYEAMNNLEGGFLFIAAAMLILNVCNFVSLQMIKSDSTERNVSTGRNSSGERNVSVGRNSSGERNVSVGRNSSIVRNVSESEARDSKAAGENASVGKSSEGNTRGSLKEVLRNTLGNRSFAMVIIMSSLWSISRYMTIGFLGTFKTTDLLLSVGAIQVINMVANLCRLALSKPFGRYSDRTSFASGYRLGLTLAACAFAVNIFCTRQTWWCIIIYTILFNVSYAGTNMNGFNITYSYVKSEYVVQAMAIEKSISGILGFVAALAGGQILQSVQSAGNTFLGIPMYGQQLLSAISLIIAVVTIVFTKLVVERQSRMVQ